MKVLQVFGSLDMGGAESRMMDVYRHIDRDKYQFDFLTMTAHKQYFEEEILSLGGQVIKIQSPRSCGILKHLKQLRECMRMGGYNAVHAHTSYHCGLVMVAAWMEHIPVRISHARTTNSKQRGKMKVIFQRAGTVLVNVFSTHRLAISNDAGRYLFGRKKFEVVPNAIDLEKYQNVNESEVRSVAEQIGIKDSSFVIGQIGRFDSMKNHRFTVHWFAHYLKGNPTSLLVLVGDGALRTEIEESVQRLGIEKNVLFTGVRSDVNIILHSFDLLFFPSVFEGLGGVALEAQAAGVPCVESDTIPVETDFGLGLIFRCSCNDTYEVWDRAVNQCRNIVAPEYGKIKDVFDKRGYSLSAVASRYIELYGS
jgi:glycosyltransferase EpsF